MKNKIIEWLSSITTSNLEITPDILILQFRVVNAFMIGNKDEWVLVDTGLENSANYIFKIASKRFGKDNKPKCIILTHGHFDHIGSLIKLIEKWNVPVFIHRLELPYITGKKDYPLADSTVGEGIVAKMSPTFPHTSINIGNNAKPIPEDGSIPHLPDWKWIHTSGHSEGHISLFRDKDKILIVGDAFCTVKQESISSVITQYKTISGPPKYFTTDWDRTEKSVKILKKLNPKLILPSHGEPIQGDQAEEYLNNLVNDFKEIAIPKQGKFVDKK